MGVFLEFEIKEYCQIDLDDVLGEGFFWFYFVGVLMKDVEIEGE